MTVVQPVAGLRGSARVPSSKPHCQRAYLLAALADGESRIRPLNSCSESDLVAASCQEFGARFGFAGDGVVVHGVAGRPAQPTVPLPMAGSGFALRNLLAIASLVRGTTVFVGSEGLAHRPLLPLMESLTALGARVESLAPDATLPAVCWSGGIRGGTLDVPAHETSQFASALLLVAPYATGPVRLRLSGPVVGAHYIDMTVGMMRRFGADVRTAPGSHEIEVRPGGYTGHTLTIGPDVTSLFYFVAAAVLVDVDVVLADVPVDGDPLLVSALDIAHRLGVRVSRHGQSLRIRSGPPPTERVVVDSTDVPTLVPALAAVASSLPHGMLLTGARHLRHHKTSRLDVMLAELAKLGRVLTPVHADGVLDGFVTGGVCPPSGEPLESHGDHRLFMALYLAGLAGDVPVPLDGAETLVTSFPDFLRVFQVLAVPRPRRAAGSPARQRERLTASEATA